ncbi:profilin-4 isoform X1 [Hyla sarda]|uniref:profilin-4 isoform X1 n=1 Tax=Hyla sarda TaxID=327740 RepID=UPI0024C218FF|nr:profilin-4 isoform X1 [Hyla sarda]XP_056420322.1 profilin-4 isoform X1 [Hyla sarda]
MNQIQNLLYDALIKTQHVESAALIKVKEAIALTSPGYHLQPQQVNGIIDAFKNPAALRREGLHFREKNYKCIRADKNSIYAKCDNDGVIMIKTKANILLATYRDGMYPSVCVEATEKLGCYFREKEI